MNGDAAVDGADLGALLTNWGGVEDQGDINGDGVVDGADLGILLTSWGSCIIVPSWATLIEAQPDPAVVWDADLRAAISATGFAWRVKDTATQMEMLLIPPGSFQMGCCEEYESSYSLPHTVTITEAFYLGRFEVTQAQWQAQTGSNPSTFQYPSTQVPSSQVSLRPVETVSWDMIAGSAGFLSRTGFRLPTEAEWEFAYRAGTTTEFHGFTGYPNGTNDDELASRIAWYRGPGLCGTGCQTRPVGGKAGNGFGLHDMGGNVLEWVNDWHSANYYASSPPLNPSGPLTGTARTLRGGSWYSKFPNQVGSYVRGPEFPSSTHFDLGFRVARSVRLPLSAVFPKSGLTTGGSIITLSGSDLLGTSAIRIGGVEALNITVVDSTTVTAVTPPGSSGLKSIVVTTPDGEAVLRDSFTYVDVQVPSWATLIEAVPDPTVVWDPALRAALGDTGLAWKVRDKGTNVEMMLIPPGVFQMGCSPSNQSSCGSEEYPVHLVTLSNAFYLSRFEVTQLQWQAIMGSNPSFFKSESTEVPLSQVLHRPVERVSWNMISGADGFLARTGFRLPSEAEWEFAFRGGSSAAHPGYLGAPSGWSDDTLVRDIAWYSSNSVDQTRPVGGKAGNGFGLHDMGGNVWEWVGDWYGANYYAVSPPLNPPGPSVGSLRLLRGGSWTQPPGAMRASTRVGYSPSDAYLSVGFRVARSP
jgi:formylglycine-generating enzyme required for sulfatase activity